MNRSSSSDLLTKGAKTDLWMKGGKTLVRHVIDEPIKEAVREAYAEELARAGEDVEIPTEGRKTGSTRRSTRDDETRTGKKRRITLPRLLIPLAGVAGIAYLRRRRKRRGRSGSSLSGTGVETPEHAGSDVSQADGTSPVEPDRSA